MLDTLHSSKEETKNPLTHEIYNDGRAMQWLQLILLFEKEHIGDIQFPGLGDF